MKFKLLPILLIISVFVISGCAQQPSPSPTPTAITTQTPVSTNTPTTSAQLEVANTFSYLKDVSPNQWYYITGIVKNVGKDPVKHARVNVTYYLADGTRKYNDNIVPWPPRLEPGQKAAFAYQVGKLETPNQFDIGNYKVEPSTFQVTEKAIKDIEIVSKKTDDSTYFLATVKNVGNRTLTRYVASVTTYDNQGHVLDAGGGLLIPSDLKELLPGQTAEFKKVISHPSKELKTTDFDIEFDYSEVK